MPLTRNAFLKLGAASAVAFAFRGSAALAATVELSGSVTYRQRIALPDTARLDRIPPLAVDPSRIEGQGEADRHLTGRFHRR